MDYERIDKPSHHNQAGGFSPRKLQAMLMGVDKKRKDEEELDSRFSSKYEAGEIDYRRGGASEGFKDVDVVASTPECSTSMEMTSNHRLRDLSSMISKVSSEEEDSYDSENMSTLAFEFHKPDRPVHRPALVLPFSKPPPSKWDDAEKWIASPTSNRMGKSSGMQQPKKSGLIGNGNRNTAAAKVVLEVPHKVDAKRMDPTLAKREVGEQKVVSWVPPVVDSNAKPAHIVDNLVNDSADSLSRHDPSQSLHSCIAYVTSPTAMSVPMRDMGTEMTPVASQEPSRMGTPVRATTPTRSPNSSRRSTPGRTTPSSTAIESSDSHGESCNKVLSEKELHMEFRREIMVLGTQLGKANIAAWASKEEEETDASTSLKSVDQPAKSFVETHAATWEEAEKSKYLARFKEEETKIQVWENCQKAKAEIEMKKIEVEAERMRVRGHDRLTKRLSAARHKAEEKRAAAESKRDQQYERAVQQAEYIRRTGRIPSSSSCWSWCS